MIYLLFFSLLSVSFGFRLKTLNDTVENKTDLENALKMLDPKNLTLDVLEESLKKFILNVENLIKDTLEDSAVFLENLEHEKINQVLQLFDSAPCVGVHEFEDLKKSFRIELGLLEVPVRETIVELSDKFVEMKRSIDIERSLFGVKRVSCQLINTTNCTLEEKTEQPPCSNGSCTTSQNPVTLHNNITLARNGSEEVVKIVRGLMSTECSNGNFRCTSGECTAMSNVCTGTKTCSDGTDEISGCPRTCPQKRCRNLNCISEDKICNGVDDCGDGTDENNCIKHNEGNCSTTLGRFLCKDSLKCFSLSAVCNGYKDCHDGSDEAGSCNDTSSCSGCLSVGGSCFPTPQGPLCLRTCPLDFTLDIATGVCTYSGRSSQPFIVYKSVSFLGVADKLKNLTKHFQNSYILLKKHMYQVMEITVHNLNKCREVNNKRNNSLSNPFFIV